MNRLIIVLSVVFVLLFCSNATTVAQTQTVGTLLNSSASFDGYTLFAPISSRTTYLIDNCGQAINQWEATDRPALSAYLLDDGSLLRTQQSGNTTFVSGGSGGTIQRFDWNGNLVWDYNLSSTTECQHHDIEFLPNGNVLIVAWESKTNQQVVAEGRNPAITPTTFWPDKIVEIQPTGLTTGTVVWEWHAWDHLIQNFDATKNNYGVIEDHPELININYPTSSISDWLHVNSVDYNPEFDQIVLSVHNTDELWIIDHSTTTAESASHSGGTYGKGGDLLYRWGNPIAYGRGDAQSQYFYVQHDARWITEGDDAGKLMIFNNGQNRVSGLSYSTIDVIDPPVDAFGVYTPPLAGQSFLPTGLFWSYQSNPISDFYASNISGAHRLPNNNTLICDGRAGRFFEVDATDNVVWDYKSPIGNGAPVAQGTTQLTGNSVFRCTRYAPDFAGFTGKDLTPGSVIELKSTAICDLFPQTTAVTAIELDNTQVISDYTAKTFSINNGKPNSTVDVFDSFGRLMHSSRINSDHQLIQTTSWPSGIYLLSVQTENSRSVTKLIVN